MKKKENTKGSTGMSDKSVMEPMAKEEYTASQIRNLKKISKPEPFDQYLINNELKPKTFVTLTDAQGNSVIGGT